MITEIVCRLGLHKWMKYTAASGAVFRFCERCGKQQRWTPGRSWREIGSWKDVAVREY